MVFPEGVERFKHKIEALKKARALNPDHTRQKLSEFILIIGSKPKVLRVGQDRELALQKALSILNVEDTVVFLSKAVASIGDFLITKDQLVLTRSKF